MFGSSVSCYTQRLPNMLSKFKEGDKSWDGVRICISYMHRRIILRDIFLEVFFSSLLNKHIKFVQIKNTYNEKMIE